MLTQGQHSASLSLCDFSQSRLLINFQIINVKVIVTPFHSGADKPGRINIPVRGCRSGWYDTHGLIPSLPCCCHHVNSAREEVKCPLRVPLQQQERCLLIASKRAGKERKCAVTPTVYCLWVLRRWCWNSFNVLELQRGIIDLFAHFLVIYLPGIHATE